MRWYACNLEIFLTNPALKTIIYRFSLFITIIIKNYIPWVNLRRMIYSASKCDLTLNHYKSDWWMWVYHHSVIKNILPCKPWPKKKNNIWAKDYSIGFRRKKIDCLQSSLTIAFISCKTVEKFHPNVMLCLLIALTVFYSY